MGHIGASDLTRNEDHGQMSGYSNTGDYPCTKYAPIEQGGITKTMGLYRLV